MIEFKIDKQTPELHFECRGDVSEIYADSMLLLRRIYDTIQKQEGEDVADHYIRFVIDMLKNPISHFYDPVEWDNEDQEDPKC